MAWGIVGALVAVVATVATLATPADRRMRSRRPVGIGVDLFAVNSSLLR
jgi:hypothetical protein